MTYQVSAPGGSLVRTPPRRPRRILMTTDSVGGVWRYALELASSLQLYKIRVSLLGFGPPPSRAQRAEADALEIRIDWESLPLDWMPEGLARLTAVRNAIVERANLLCVDLLHLNSLALPSRIMAPSPMVAVAHSCMPTWWRAVRGGASAPKEWSAHERANRDGYRTASLVIAPSCSHAEAVSDIYGTHPHLRVVYNSSSKGLAPRRRREPIIFAAGRWWDDAKNVRALDAAAAHSKWPIAMAGSLQAPDGRRKTISHAHALGPLDACATNEWMRRASIFAAPSIYEPFGLAILEAARAGTPLVLADIATFRELWDGAAIFVPPHDPSAFAQALNQLASDEHQRHVLGRRASARAQQFTRERQATAMLSAYEDATSLQATAACLEGAMER